MGLTLRPATLADSQLLYEWRVRDEADADWWKGTPVTAAAHQRWMAVRVDNPALRLWIAEDNNEPVGMVRLDSNGELTVDVVPERRGEGLGTRMIVAACALAKDMGHTRVKASIDNVNESSMRAFEKAGFEYHADVFFFVWRP